MRERHLKRWRTVFRQGSHLKHRTHAGEYLNVSKICLFLVASNAAAHLVLDFEPYSVARPDALHSSSPAIT
jgi:hypothetical protein